MAGDRVSPPLQATDRGGEVPVPQGPCAAKTPDILLFGLGVALLTRPPDRVNYLSGTPTAMGFLPTAITAKVNHPSTCIIECENPTLISAEGKSAEANAAPALGSQPDGLAIAVGEPGFGEMLHRIHQPTVGRLRPENRQRLGQQVAFEHVVAGRYFGVDDEFEHVG